MTVRYRTKLPNEYFTSQAINFINSFDSNVYYVTFGRGSDTWSSIENNTNFQPPMPVNSTLYKSDFYKLIDYYTKINNTNIKLVTERVDWQPNNSYDLYSLIITNSTNDNLDITIPNTGYGVYKCVSKSSDNIESVNYPTYNNGGMASIDTEDGYSWEYMYSIPLEMIENYTTKEYIPVPAPSDLVTDTNILYWGLDLVNYTRFDINSLSYKLNVSKIMIHALLSDSDPVSVYRQIGIVSNPWEYALMVDQNFPDGIDSSQSGWKIQTKLADNASYLSSEILQETGQLIYMENRPPIEHSPGEIQKIQIVIGF